jgi:DNA adenine methylase
LPQIADRPKVEEFFITMSIFDSQIQFTFDESLGVERYPRRILRTYLRYPGGKSKAIKSIDKFIPPNFKEYREGMVGGGSMFLHIRKKYPDVPCWINDIYRNLYLFWIACRDNNTELIDALLKIKNETTIETSAEKFDEIKNTIDGVDDFTKAVYFYYLNKCSFSGLTESGTCSAQAWKQNFSHSSIESLYDLQFILKDVKITNLDYSELLAARGDNVFIYLDPPYDIGKANVLYGRNGEIHEGFDHIRFYAESSSAGHKIMVSYNDSEVLRSRFSNFKIHDLPLRYTMRLTQKGRGKKNELVMCNYG